MALEKLSNPVLAAFLSEENKKEKFQKHQRIEAQMASLLATKVGIPRWALLI